jgi:hypothetical protein
MTKVKTTKKKEALKKRADKLVKPFIKDVLYVAGYFHKGKNKGGKIAIAVKNMGNLNPVEPILAQYPDIEVVLVGKNKEAVMKFFKKLAD